MDIQVNLVLKKEIEQRYIDYLEQEEDQDFEIIFHDKLSYLIEDRDELHDFLRLISTLSCYHYRSPNFFNKIDQSLLFLKYQITHNFTNFEIFHIFHISKRILLFLFEEKIIKPTESIANVLLKLSIHQNFDYLNYCLNEIKQFIPEEIRCECEKENLRIIENLGSDNEFENWRKLGENEDYVSQLIRKDSIEEFVSYVNRNVISLSKTLIKPSIFDTNLILIDEYLSLIEYASFFGSIQIFKYLYLNNVDVNPSIWKYAIHGNNPEIIHFLEENYTKPNDKTLIDCFDESIICHHNDIANYYQNNFLTRKKFQKIDHSVLSIEYCNYSYFPDDLNCPSSLFYFCKYNCISLVKILLKDNHFDLNEKIIFFFKILTKKFLNLFV